MVDFEGPAGYLPFMAATWRWAARFALFTTMAATCVPLADGACAYDVEAAGAWPVGGVGVVREMLAMVMTSAAGAPVRRRATLFCKGDVALVVGGAATLSLLTAFTSRDAPSSYSISRTLFLYASSLFPRLCRELHPIYIPFCVGLLIAVSCCSKSVMLDFRVARESGAGAA